MTRRAAARPRGSGDPLGTVLTGSLVAPGLAIVGLLVVAIVTLGLMNGEVPFIGGSTGNGTGNGGVIAGPDRTAAPSNVVVVEPEVSVPGSIVYVKSGNVWVQSGTDARQITKSGRDSMPSWSPDGRSIYYIESTPDPGLWLVNGSPRRYDLEYPNLMRIAADGSGEPVRLATGHFTRGRYDWFFWIRQPVLSPDGSRFALVSDGPDPEKSDAVLQFFDPKTKKFTPAGVQQTPPLGHQDPAWRADGKRLLYVRNGRDGARGAPVIMRYDVATKKVSPLTGPGYLHPAFSPDGRYIAATRTSTFGTDVVILDASSGRELATVTNDERSWAPVWSPAGDAIAYLNIDGQIVDLKLAKLEGPGPSWTVTETTHLTEVSGLDPASKPGWFIPPEELPATPAPVAPEVDASIPPSVAP
jgi:dipeptidyl aminopeptidase/acylaminoacyl peptidase